MASIPVELNQSNTLSSLVPEDLIDEMGKYPSINFEIEQHIYEGVYYRTAKIPKDTVALGLVVKIPTTLIVSGKCLMVIGNDTVLLDGYYVFSGSPKRQQMFRALEDTYMTMIFKTEAKTVEEAEKEFTNEWDLLQTNYNNKR